MKQLILLAVLACTFLTSIAVAQDAGRIITGDVVANRSVTLASRIMGRVTAIHAEESDAVSKDKALVELDDSEYQARLKVAEAALERALADQAHKQRTLTRLESLGVSSSVSQEAIDNALFGVEAAAANVKASEAEIESIKVLLAETRIVVPFDAVVIGKMAELGMVTQPGQTLFEIHDQSSLKFRARIKERDLKDLSVGDQATVIITALGNLELDATVDRLIPSGDARHTFLIELKLPEKTGLYPGMFGKAVLR